MIATGQDEPPAGIIQAMENGAERTRVLMITADDYGYWPSYNQGILEAVEAGAVDSVSAMVDREYCDPAPLEDLGVEVGLHMEFEGRRGPRSGAPAKQSLRVQLERFTDLFGRWPTYLDGHHHCHARPELATPVMEMALQLKIPVRSVSRDHRQWLRERNIPTQDALIGRTDSSEPAQPPELLRLPPGVSEWVVHPGHPDPESGSSYDRARQEDLDVIGKLALRARFDRAVWGTATRANHAEALLRAEPEPDPETTA